MNYRHRVGKNLKSECRNSKSETNSNVLNSNDQNKKFASISFHGVAHGYTYGTAQVLNIGNSDFGFLPAEAGEFRISCFDFFEYFHPGSVGPIRIHR
jgi:hypothetical protein